MGFSFDITGEEHNTGGFLLSSMLETDWLFVRSLFLGSSFILFWLVLSTKALFSSCLSRFSIATSFRVLIDSERSCLPSDIITETSGKVAATFKVFKSSRTFNKSPSPFSATDRTKKSSNVSLEVFDVDLISDICINDSSVKPLLCSLFMVFPKSKKRWKIRVNRLDDIISAIAPRNVAVFVWTRCKLSLICSQKRRASIFLWTRGIGIMAKQNFSPFVKSSNEPVKDTRRGFSRSVGTIWTSACSISPESFGSSVSIAFAILL